MVHLSVDVGWSSSHRDVAAAVFDASLRAAQQRSSLCVRSRGRIDCGNSSAVCVRDAAHPFELLQRSREIVSTIVLKYLVRNTPLVSWGRHS